MPTHIENRKAIISLGAIPIAKARAGNEFVYPAGAAVTYHVDTHVAYTEEVDSGETCLAPRTFTPTKEGWEFVGWRLDSVANKDVVDSLLMDDEPITLYAVFRQVVTVTYYNGNTTEQTSTGYVYYNNLNTLNPTFTIPQTPIAGLTLRGWSIGTTGNAAISYTSISDTPISADITLYGMYQQNITLSYNANSGSGITAAQTGVRYYNSGSNTYVNPSFTLSANGFSRSGYTFVQWRLNGTSGTAYAPNATLTLSANATLYAEWRETNLTVFAKSAWNVAPSVYNSSVVKFTNFGDTTGQYVGYAGVKPSGTENGSQSVYKNFNIVLPTGYKKVKITISFRDSGSYEDKRYIEYYLNPSETYDGTNYCGTAYRHSNSNGTDRSDYTGTDNGSGTVRFKIAARRSGTGNLEGGPWINSIVIS